jgi:hypothetical protein
MVLTAGAAALAAAPGASANPAYKVVIAHANNPRQLALVYTVFTSAGRTPPPNPPQKALRQLGNLMRVWPNGKLTKVADIDNFEFNHNPDGGPVDSDPYAVLALGHHTQILLDAGGNDALRVHNGHVRLLAVFPSNSAGKDAVPTSLTRGPDGSILVGELGGDGSPNGASRVWQIWPNRLHQTPHVYRSGFTAVTGVAWHRHSLYVCEFTTDYPNQSPNGAIVKVTGSHRTVLGAGVLHFPGGVAVHHGHVYVSQWSVLPAFRAGREPVRHRARAGHQPEPVAAAVCPGGGPRRPRGAG